MSRRPDLMPYWHPVTGDSCDVLARFLPEWGRVNLFINDSAAGRDLQAREPRDGAAVWPTAAPW